MAWHFRNLVMTVLSDVISAGSALAQSDSDIC